MSRVLKLIVSVAVPVAVGALSGFATRDAVGGWYDGLEKPSFAPPDSVFGPVWTTLYVMMGVACFLVWRESARRPGVRTALGVYAIQLVLNGLWSLLFFGLRSPIAGLIDIALLWIAIIATVVLFARISKLAGALLLPYLAWVSFAAMLNYSIWALNA
jgi:tryptophan-rich sensory protein